MLTYKTYKKIDMLAWKYLSDKYDYCGAFCNNNLLDGLLSGTLTKQQVYVRHLGYVFNELIYHKKVKQALEENPWLQKLLLDNGFPILGDMKIVDLSCQKAM